MQYDSYYIAQMKIWQARAYVGAATTLMMTGVSIALWIIGSYTCD